MDITVIFYFVSGNAKEVTFSPRKWEEYLDSLRKGWKDCSSIGVEFGINFSLVTHYEVKKG